MSPPAVWSAIEQLDQFERWWGWLGGFRVGRRRVAGWLGAAGTVSLDRHATYLVATYLAGAAR